MMCTGLLLTSCASLQPTGEPGARAMQVTTEVIEQLPVGEDKPARLPVERFSETPKLTLDQSAYTRPATLDDVQFSDGKVGVNFNSMPLNAFINEVFGNLLGMAYEVVPEVAARQDLVTLRSATEESRQQLYAMARQVLASYGVGIDNQGSYLRFSADVEAGGGELPLFLSGTALPDIPPSHRTVFFFRQLKAVRENSVKKWLTVAFGDERLIVHTDPLSNVVILQGPSSVVRQAAESVEILDRPSMRGRYSVRIKPSFVSADVLAKMLKDILVSEGIGAATEPQFASVVVLPVSPTNSVIVFSPDLQVLDHVKAWAIELDQPVTQSSSNDFFYYQVQNTSAQELAATLSGVEDTGDEAGAAATAEGIYVDKNRNGLIFTGEPESWKSYLPIIKAMDRPPVLVNVEVTVASVSLSEDADFGVEWLFEDSHGRFNGIGQSNFGLGGSGFSYSLTNAGQVRLALNALRQNQRVSILSKPSILVKSGDTASIDVGQEVPILSSQAQSTDNAGAPVLQNITYRKTGVLLEVEPTVHSTNQIDLDINQEVSEVLDSVASSVDSPSIFNRRLKTSLTLRDGGAVILGGLISNATNEGDNRVPILGNIPGFGALFRSSGNQETRSELVLVIQAYIVDFEEKNWDFNAQLREKLNLLDATNLKLRQ